MQSFKERRLLRYTKSLPGTHSDWSDLYGGASNEGGESGLTVSCVKIGSF